MNYKVEGKEDFTPATPINRDSINERGNGMPDRRPMYDDKRDAYQDEPYISSRKNGHSKHGKSTAVDYNYDVE